MVNIIESGSMFGELGIIYHRQRAASCIALTEIEVGYMGKDDFFEAFGTIQKDEERAMTNYIEDHIIIVNDLKYLAPKFGIMFKKKHMRRGNTLFKKGDTPNIIYFVYSGQVALRYSWNVVFKNKRHLPLHFNKSSKRSETFVILCKGEMIGEEALFKPERLDYDVVTDTQCNFFYLEVDKLRSLCSTNKHIRDLMFDKVSKKREMIQRRMKPYLPLIRNGGMQMLGEKDFKRPRSSHRMKKTPTHGYVQDDYETPDSDPEPEDLDYLPKIEEVYTISKEQKTINRSPESIRKILAKRKSPIANQMLIRNLEQKRALKMKKNIDQQKHDLEKEKERGRQMEKEFKKSLLDDDSNKQFGIKLTRRRAMTPKEKKVHFKKNGYNIEGDKSIKNQENVIKKLRKPLSTMGKILMMSKQQKEQNYPHQVQVSHKKGKGGNHDNQYFDWSLLQKGSPYSPPVKGKTMYPSYKTPQKSNRSRRNLKHVLRNSMDSRIPKDTIEENYHLVDIKSKGDQESLQLKNTGQFFSTGYEKRAEPSTLVTRETKDSFMRFLSEENQNKNSSKGTAKQNYVIYNQTNRQTRMAHAQLALPETSKTGAEHSEENKSKADESPKHFRIKNLAPSPVSSHHSGQTLSFEQYHNESRSWANPKKRRLQNTKRIKMLQEFNKRLITRSSKKYKKRRNRGNSRPSKSKEYFHQNRSVDISAMMANKSFQGLRSLDHDKTEAQKKLEREVMRLRIKAEQPDDSKDSVKRKTNISLYGKFGLLKNKKTLKRRNMVLGGSKHQKRRQTSAGINGALISVDEFILSKIGSKYHHAP